MASGKGLGKGYSKLGQGLDAIFGENTVAKCPDLKTRIELFKNII